MIIDIYQIDAFTTRLFSGNPAAVCPLKQWLPDELLLNIAKENNLAETAFFTHLDGNRYHLRWFTPEIEMDLCGHATLATAFVIFNYVDNGLNEIVFQSLSGELIVRRTNEHIELNFPARPATPAELPKIISRSLSIQPTAVYKARDYVLHYQNYEDVLNLKVSATILADLNLDPGGIIVTALGRESDFVSRFFTPGASVFEDPVTGSAHCTLVPFWAERLNKNKLHAIQLSDRGGELFCEFLADRVLIRGSAVNYLRGTIEI